MKRILITGASGLVGSAVVEMLKGSEEWIVYAASSRVCPESAENIRRIGNSEIEKTFEEEQIDVLLHLAFPRNAKEGEWAEGMAFAARVLGAAKKYGVGKVIHVSSQSIYGWQRTEAAREGDPIVLNSPYTTGKYCFELMVNEIFGNVPHTNVRLSTVIGPTTDERVPNKLFAQAAAGKTLKIKGGGQIFSFLDVRDAASGLVRLIEADGPLRKVYNLGTKEYATLLQIAEMVVGIAVKNGCSTGIELESADIVLNNMLDVSAMEEDFGWTAVHSLEESLEYIYAENYQEKQQ